jgi:hypothetical protein
LAIKFEAEFPVKCKRSAPFNELGSGGVVFDASNCTDNVFVSNGVCAYDSAMSVVFQMMLCKSLKTVF